MVSIVSQSILLQRLTRAYCGFTRGRCRHVTERSGIKDILNGLYIIGWIGEERGVETKRCRLRIISSLNFYFYLFSKHISHTHQSKWPVTNSLQVSIHHTKQPSRHQHPYRYRPLKISMNKAAWLAIPIPIEANINR